MTATIGSWGLSLCLRWASHKSWVAGIQGSHTVQEHWVDVFFRFLNAYQVALRASELCSGYLVHIISSRGLSSWGLALLLWASHWCRVVGTYCSQIVQVVWTMFWLSPPHHFLPRTVLVLVLCWVLLVVVVVVWVVVSLQMPPVHIWCPSVLPLECLDRKFTQVHTDDWINW